MIDMSPSSPSNVFFSTRNSRLIVSLCLFHISSDIRERRCWLMIAWMYNSALTEGRAKESVRGNDRDISQKAQG